MSSKISLINDEKIIQLIYQGVVTPEDLYAAVKECAAISNQRGIKLFLADLTGFTGGHTVFDIYNLVHLYEKVGLQRDVKEALLLPNKNETAEDVKFYETVCANNGMNVKIVASHQAGIDWLLNG